MTKDTNPNWRHIYPGAKNMRSLEHVDEYVHEMQCINCRNTIHIGITKGISIIDVVEGVDCPNCGIIQHGASKHWI